MAATDVLPALQHGRGGSQQQGEDEESLSSIRAMTITIGGGEENTGYTLQPDQARSTESRQELLPTSETLQGHIAPAGPSSLRALLGVPASSSSTLGSRIGQGNKSGMLGVPPRTSAKTAPMGVGGAPSSISGRTIDANGVETLPSEIAPRRRKVVLGPGCSALDWARLKSIIPAKGFRKITPSELKMHKSKHDAWSAFNGKVYDITPYLRFHPGGEDELMRVAGRDGTRLFMLTHSWVNIDSMIDSCIVGILVSEAAGSI